MLVYMFADHLIEKIFHPLDVSVPETSLGMLLCREFSAGEGQYYI